MNEKWMKMKMKNENEKWKRKEKKYAIHIQHSNFFITKSADDMTRTFQTKYENQYLMDFKTQKIYL